MVEKVNVNSFEINRVNDSKFYKLGNTEDYSSLWAVTIFPGNLCGCRMTYFSWRFF